MSYSSRPRALGDVLRDLISDLGIEKKIDESRAIEAWAALAGPTINAVTETAWMKNGCLYVRLTSAVWRHELTLQRGRWRERLNEQLGADVVDEIVFR